MDIEITTDRSKVNLKYVHHYLSEKSYWAKDTSPHCVEKSVDNSICYSIFINFIFKSFSKKTDSL